MADVELNTLGSVIKTAYEGQSNTNAYTDAEKTKLSGIATGAEVNAVDSVNTQTGAVVLDADDIDDAATTNKFVTASDLTNLGNLSGTNTGDQTITLTGDVTGSGTGSFAATIANKTGTDTGIVTGTAGTSGQIGQWNEDGDLVGVDAVTASQVDSESATDGYVLTADGSGNAAWEAVSGGSGGSGALVEFDTQEFSGVSSVEFTDLPNSWVAYLYIDGLANGGYISIQVSDDTGASPTFDTGSTHYAYSGVRLTETTPLAEVQAESDDVIRILGFIQSAGQSGAGRISCVNGHETTAQPKFFSESVTLGTSSACTSAILAGRRKASQATNAIRFINDSGGNFSGRIQILEIVESA